MIFDVTAHPILIAKALALASQNVEAFEAQVDLAESLLNIPETLPSGELALKRLKLAVAMQVNFQIQQDLDPLILESSFSAHARNSFHYRDRSIDPRAYALVSQALGGVSGRYRESLTSLRFHGR